MLMKIPDKYLLLMLVMMLAVLTSCEHEIDFDYPSADELVVFDGCISNEGVLVKISRIRPMTDSTKNHLVSDAQVWISSDDGDNEQLVYDEQQHGYVSPSGMVGTPGHQYKMVATVDGHDYEATTEMLLPAPVDSVFYRWTELMNERIFFFSLRVIDPYPNERNYYWYKVMRGDEVFRWNCRSDRGCPPGYYEYDITCSMEKDLDKEVDDDGKRPLHEGDELWLEMMTIDKATYEYFQSLMTGNYTLANPITNIKGGAQGFFTAVNITRSASLRFNKEIVLSQNE